MDITKKLHRRTGQGTVEYVLILALVVGLLVLLWQQVGPKMQTKIEKTAEGINQTQ